MTLNYKNSWILPEKQELEYIYCIVMVGILRLQTSQHGRESCDARCRHAGIRETDPAVPVDNPMLSYAPYCLLLIVVLRRCRLFKLDGFQKAHAHGYLL